MGASLNEASTLPETRCTPQQAPAAWWRFNEAPAFLPGKWLPPLPAGNHSINVCRVISTGFRLPRIAFGIDATAIVEAKRPRDT